MFMGHNYAGAANRYAAVHAGARAEGASPHVLVKILFDELLLAMDAAMLAEERGDRTRAADREARALAILPALEGSLDFRRGGEIAVGLSQIYRESRRLVLAGAQQRDPAEIGRARAMIAEIADAWARIG